MSCPDPNLRLLHKPTPRYPFGDWAWYRVDLITRACEFVDYASEDLMLAIRAEQRRMDEKHAGPPVG